MFIIFFLCVRVSSHILTVMYANWKIKFTIVSYAIQYGGIDDDGMWLAYTYNTHAAYANKTKIL